MNITLPKRDLSEEECQAYLEKLQFYGVVFSMNMMQRALYIEFSMCTLRIYFPLGSRLRNSRMRENLIGGPYTVHGMEQDVPRPVYVRPFFG